MDKENFFKKEIANFHIPRWEELPNLDLYLDQVVCFIDEFLSNYIDTDNEKHVITKTMINNYVKHKVINPPLNKKYNKEHIASLFAISILKQLYSISDISKLINIALEKNSPQIVYNKFCDELENAINVIFSENKYNTNNNENLSFDIYSLRNLAFSFANKLYVEKVYLKK